MTTGDSGGEAAMAASASQTMEQRRSRHSGIDAMRLFAFAAVAVLHAVGDGAETSLAMTNVIADLCRFAVPFFFVASGYFLTFAPVGAALRRLARMLLPLFVFWAVFYVAYFEGSLVRLERARAVIELFWNGLNGYHLWFLPALGISAALFSILKTRLSWRGIFAVAAILYLAGMVLGPWRIALGLPEPPINTRNGPFFAFFFVSAGVWLRQHPPRVTASAAVALVVVSALALFAEIWLLRHLNTIVTPRAVDFTLATAPFGVGMFLVAITAGDRLPIPAFVRQLSTLTFGLYAIHLLFLSEWQEVIGKAGLGQRLLIAVLTIASSVVAVWIAARVPYVRRLVQ